MASSLVTVAVPSKPLFTLAKVLKRFKPDFDERLELVVHMAHAQTKALICPVLPRHESVLSVDIVAQSAA